MTRRRGSGSGEPARLDPALRLQVRVSRVLGLGFVLSLAWIGGAGSLSAFAAGLWARRVIRKSGGAVVGIRLAWWCILAGALGAGVALAYWLQFASGRLRPR